jgi:hypothetical protein
MRKAKNKLNDSGAWFPLALGGVICIITIFWTWGRELEDRFDDANTQNLNRIIVKSDASNNPAIKIGRAETPEIDMAGQEEVADSRLYLRRTDNSLLELQRIPVMSIFHRNDTAGKGVPHSFAGFLQRYPALPEVVVGSVYRDSTHGANELGLPVDSRGGYPARRPRRALHRFQSPLPPRFLHSHHAYGLPRSRPAISHRPLAHLDFPRDSLGCLSEASER